MIDNIWVRLARSIVVWVISPFIFGVCVGFLFSALFR